MYTNDTEFYISHNATHRLRVRLNPDHRAEFVGACAINSRWIEFPRGFKQILQTYREAARGLHSLDYPQFIAVRTCCCRFSNCWLKTQTRSNQTHFITVVSRPVRQQSDSEGIRGTLHRSSGWHFDSAEVICGHVIRMTSSVLCRRRSLIGTVSWRAVSTQPLSCCPVAQ